MPMQSLATGKGAALYVCIGLAVALGAIYWQTSSFEFVNWDDDAYIYANPQILKGMTFENVSKAFTATQNNLWHPVATLTHLMDVQLYGLKAGGHHVTNVLIHIAGSLLLFIALKHLTGALYESAFAAALFAIHPLRVESVAWVTERKDVLTGFFLALLLMAYSYYVRGPSLRRYGLVGLAFMMGAMSKPSFVTVPFALLLLDYWPLRRDEPSSGAMAGRSNFGRLLIEKLPLILFSAGVCAMTILAQRSMAIVSLEQLSLGQRVLNAGRSYLIYLIQFFWPTNLIAFYEFRRDSLALWQGVAGWCVILLITGIVLYFYKTRRYLAVGWFWYLGMLLPMIGLLQVGLQGHADRFTYLPQIGIAIAIAFGLAEWTRQRAIPRQLLTVGVLAVLGTLSVISYRQTTHWRNGESLFAHALDAQAPSEVTCNLLGIALHRQGRVAEATEMYRRAVELNPNFPPAVANLGNALSSEGHLAPSIPVLEQAIELDPDSYDVAYNLATSLMKLGRFDEAIVRLEVMRKKYPKSALLVVNLGLAKFRQGKIEEAITDYRSALEIDPQLPEGYAHLAAALAQKESRSAAIEAFRESIRLRSNDVETLKSAAWVIATAPDISPEINRDGLEWAKRAVELTGGSNPIYLIVLAASYAANNQFDKALAVADQVEKWAARHGNLSIAETIRSHSEQYRQGRPVR